MVQQLIIYGSKNTEYMENYIQTKSAFEEMLADKY
jgi:hypothetical protein